MVTFPSSRSRSILSIFFHAEISFATKKDGYFEIPCNMAVIRYIK